MNGVIYIYLMTFRIEFHWSGLEVKLLGLQHALHHLGQALRAHVSVEGQLQRLANRCILNKHSPAWS